MSDTLTIIVSILVPSIGIQFELCSSCSDAWTVWKNVLLSAWTGLTKTGLQYVQKSEKSHKQYVPNSP